MNLEHPDITKTLATGYPTGRHGGAGFFCDFCTREIMIGEDYMDVDQKYICWRCANRMRKTAGEE